MTLKVGQEGLFFLHDVGNKEALYAARYYWDVADKDSPQFAAEVEQAKEVRQGARQPHGRPEVRRQKRNAC